jgi:hypothetical protein
VVGIDGARGAVGATLWAVDEAVSRDTDTHESLDSSVLQLGVEEAQLRGASPRVITARRSRFTDSHDVRAASEGNRLVQARPYRRLACWRRRYPDLDLRLVAVDGSAVKYVAQRAADIQLVVVGCGEPITRTTAPRRDRNGQGLLSR